MAEEHPDKPQGRDEASKLFLEQYEDSRDHFMDKVMRNKFADLYRAYRAYYEVQDANQKSNLGLPLIASHVDSFVARLSGARPIIEVWPRTPEDIERARKHRLLLDYQWDALDMLFHLLMLSKTAMIHGVGWGKVTWRREVRPRMVRNQLTTQSDELGMDPGLLRQVLSKVAAGVKNTVAGEVRPQMSDTVVWDNPFFEVLEPDSIYPHRSGFSLDTCTYVIERSVADVPEMEALEKGGNIKFVPGALAELRRISKGGNLLAEGRNQVTLAERAARTFGGTRDTSSGTDETQRQFHLLEKWTDGKVQWLVEEAPEIGLLRDEPHPLGMKPYIRFTPDPLPNELIGTSLTERLFSLTMHANTTINAINDATLSTINAKLLIPRTSLTNPQHLRDRSRSWAFADMQNKPEYLIPPELKAGGYRYLEFLMEQMEQIGGTRTFRGLGGDGDTTATEADLLARASGTKAGMMLQVLNSQPLKRLGRLMVRLNEQNVDGVRSVRVLGDRFAEVTEQNFVAVSSGDLVAQGTEELDVTIDIASTDPDTRAFKERRAAERMTAMSQAAQSFPEFRPLARAHAVALARLSDDIPDPDKLIEQGMEELQRAQEAEAAAVAGENQGSLETGQNVGNNGEQLAADLGAEVVF